MPETPSQTMQTQIETSIMQAIQAQTRVLEVLNENLRLLGLLSRENWGLEILKNDLAKALEEGKADGDEATERTTNQAHS